MNKRASFDFENLVVQYDLQTYKFDQVKALPTDGFYDAVAKSLNGSVEKWSTIQKGETNLGALINEKLAKYWQEKGIDVVIDKHFIKWMVGDFVENEASHSFHAVYQCPDVNFDEIRQLIEKDPAYIPLKTKAALVQFALRDVVTIVQPGTRWSGSEMYTTGNDEAFIFVTNKQVFQLSGHFIMTVDELRASASSDANYERHLQPRHQSRGTDGAYRALSFTYKEKTRDMGRMQEFAVAGDGNCFYRAIAVCLTRQHNQWGAIRNHETDLKTVLSAHLRRYPNTIEKGSVIDHYFLRWLVADTLLHAPHTHEMFSHRLSYDAEDFTFANKDALVRNVLAIGTDGYGGTIEGIVLHHALQKLVSIVGVEKKENRLNYSELMSRGDSDKSFMFLLQLNGNHWHPLVHSSTGRFLWTLRELEQIKELPDKCTEEAVESVADTQYARYGSYTIKVHKPFTGTYFEAVAKSLAQHRRTAEWLSGICGVIRQSYFDFVLDGENPRNDESYVKFLYRKGDSESNGGGDVFHKIEKGLNDNIYIALYNENGPLHRDKARRVDHVSTTYFVHLYTYDTPDGPKFAAIESTD